MWTTHHFRIHVNAVIEVKPSLWNIFVGSQRSTNNKNMQNIRRIHLNGVGPKPETIWKKKLELEIDDRSLLTPEHRIQNHLMQGKSWIIISFRLSMSFHLTGTQPFGQTAHHIHKSLSGSYCQCSTCMYLLQSEKKTTLNSQRSQEVDLFYDRLQGYRSTNFWNFTQNEVASFVLKPWDLAVSVTSGGEDSSWTIGWNPTMVLATCSSNSLAFNSV